VSLYERIHGVRLCTECQVHEAVQDGALCSDCLNAYLSKTRPPALREAAWLTRAKAQPHGLARAIDRSAA